MAAGLEEILKASTPQTEQTVQATQVVDLAKPKYDVDKIKWVDAESKSGKGPYKLAREQDQIYTDAKWHFNELRSALRVAGGTIGGKQDYLWLFSREDAIGRKPSKQ
jgi:hypothetical protein